jgi:hypothetical protein
LHIIAELVSMSPRNFIGVLGNTTPHDRLNLAVFMVLTVPFRRLVGAPSGDAAEDGAASRRRSNHRSRRQTEPATWYILVEFCGLHCL